VGAMKRTTRLRSDWSLPELQWHIRSPYPPSVQRELGRLCLQLAAVEGTESATWVRLADRFGVSPRKVRVFGVGKAVLAGLYRLIHLRTRDPLLEVFAEFRADREGSVPLTKPSRFARAVGWFQFRQGLRAMGASRRELEREVRAVCQPRRVDPCFISGTYAEVSR
jgi:hypothetical protein